MLFKLACDILVVALFGVLFVALSGVREKLVEKLLKQISKAETRRELVVWVGIYVAVSILILTVELYLIATVWQAIF